jgi:hypothetical protein
MDQFALKILKFELFARLRTSQSASESHSSCLPPTSSVPQHSSCQTKKKNPAALLPSTMPGHFVNYFSNTFTSTNPVLDTEMLDLIVSVISVSDNDLLCGIPDEHEIYQATTMLGPNKAPGLEGRNDLFYKNY